jgi:hypothetical protein
MSNGMLLWITSCQSRGIYWRIRKRWLSEHTADYNHHHHAIDNYDDDWHWHNNQYDD